MGLITTSYFSISISDGNPDVNSIVDSEWTVVWSTLGTQFHIPLEIYKMPKFIKKFNLIIGLVFISILDLLVN